LDELEEIEMRLKAAASDSSEEQRLSELFQKAREGLSSQTSAGVKEEVEESLGKLMDALGEKAEAIQGIFRE